MAFDHRSHFRGVASSALQGGVVDNSAPTSAVWLSLERGNGTERQTGLGEWVMFSAALCRRAELSMVGNQDWSQNPNH